MKIRILTIAVDPFNPAPIKTRFNVDISINSIGKIISGTPYSQKYDMTDVVAIPCIIKSVLAKRIPSAISKNPYPMVMAGTIE